MVSASTATQRFIRVLFGVVVLTIDQHARLLETKSDFTSLIAETAVAQALRQ